MLSSEEVQNYLIQMGYAFVYIFFKKSIEDKKSLFKNNNI